LNQLASQIFSEMRANWLITDSKLLTGKHSDILTLLRVASRKLSSALEAEDASPPSKRDTNKPFALPEIHRLPWQLLPSGDWSVDLIVNRLKSKFRERQLKGQILDEDRLRKIVTRLNPSHCYIGEHEFDGYIVFCFAEHSTVILECPVYGNAIYLIRGDWQTITRLTKGKSLSRHPTKVRRVIHGDNWVRNLQKAVNEWR
jgi:hypothetical protein